MASRRSNGVSFLLGIATGVALTHPEVRKRVRPLFRRAVQETVRLKVKLEKLAAASSEELEDFVAEMRAEQESDAAASPPASSD